MLRKVDIFDQLDDENKTILKTHVGNRVPINRMEEIILKPGSQKTGKDIDELVSIIKQIKFFKEAKNLSKLHL